MDAMMALASPKAASKSGSWPGLTDSSACSTITPGPYEAPGQGRMPGDVAPAMEGAPATGSSDSAPSLRPPEPREHRVMTATESTRDLAALEQERARIREAYLKPAGERPASSAR